MKECGGCTECCRLLDVPELRKPPNVACRHCVIGGGCVIYHNRPSVCRWWKCGWLENDHIPDRFRPDRCGFIISGSFMNGQVMWLTLNPRRVKERPARMQKLLDELCARSNDAGVSVVWKVEGGYISSLAPHHTEDIIDKARAEIAADSVSMESEIKDGTACDYGDYFT